MPNPFSKDPFALEEQAIVIVCPVCKSGDFEARQNERYTMRTCKACGNEWAGGVPIPPDFNSDPPTPPGIAAPDDYEPIRYTGASYRDPSKNWGGDE